MKYPTCKDGEGYHRKIAKKFYGREIGDDEEVHHIDGNPKNFRKENLVILKHDDHEKLSLYMKKKKIKYPKFPLVVEADKKYKELKKSKKLDSK